MRKTSGWCVYILECLNGSLYTGVTNDIRHRIDLHTKGKGAKYTRSFGVKKLVFIKKCKNRSKALKLEAQIKGMTRKEKHLLIDKQTPFVLKSTIGRAVIRP